MILLTSVRNYGRERMKEQISQLMKSLIIYKNQSNTHNPRLHPIRLHPRQPNSIDRVEATLVHLIQLPTPISQNHPTSQLLQRPLANLPIPPRHEPLPPPPRSPQPHDPGLQIRRPRRLIMVAIARESLCEIPHRLRFLRGFDEGVDGVDVVGEHGGEGGEV